MAVEPRWSEWIKVRVSEANTGVTARFTSTVTKATAKERNRRQGKIFLNVGFIISK